MENHSDDKNELLSTMTSHTPKSIETNPDKTINDLPQQVNLTKDISMLTFHRRNDKRPYITVQIKNIDRIALLDTGAQATVVGSNLMTNISEWGNKMEPYAHSILMADASRQMPLGQISVNYSLDGIKQMVPTVVLNCPTKTIILGIDFLKKFNIGITQTNIEPKNICIIERDTSLGTTAGTKPTDNILITSEDHNDQEADVFPPKFPTVSIPHVLTPQQQSQLDEVGKLFISTNPEGELNATDAIEHIIDTGEAKPVMKRQYPMSPIRLQQVQTEVDHMVKRGILTEVKYSPWRSPITAVNKRDGGIRICLDARELNHVTIPNAFPIPDTHTVLALIKTTRYMTGIDLSQAFHQVPLSKDSQEKTAFTVGGNMYCYKRMTMGLQNSPATLAILMELVFRDLQPYAFAYMDDFLICSNTFDEHLKLLTVVANRMAKVNLTYNPTKSNFCCSQLAFVGYILNQNGLTVNPERIAAVHAYTRPKTPKEVRRITFGRNRLVPSVYPPIFGNSRTFIIIDKG